MRHRQFREISCGCSWCCPSSPREAPAAGFRAHAGGPGRVGAAPVPVLGREVGTGRAYGAAAHRRGRSGRVGPVGPRVGGPGVRVCQPVGPAPGRPGAYRLRAGWRGHRRWCGPRGGPSGRRRGSARRHGAAARGRGGSVRRRRATVRRGRRGAGAGRRAGKAACRGGAAAPASRGRGGRSSRASPGGRTGVSGGPGSALGRGVCPPSGNAVPTGPIFRISPVSPTGRALRSRTRAGRARRTRW